MCIFSHCAYNKDMKKNPKKLIKFLQQFFTLDDTPHSIAAGAAVGLFMGILPVESISTSLIITTAFRLNRAAALISVAAANVWAMIAVLPLAALSGGFLFSTSPTELANQFNQTHRIGLGYFLTKASFFNFTLPLLAGYVACGALISTAFYAGLYFILKNKKQIFIK